MNGFAADWLALREPADHRARNAQVLEAVVTAMRGKDRLRIIDLACGTGSTLRALGPRLGGDQSWILVDKDPRLLGRAEGACATLGVAVRFDEVDLDKRLDSVLARPADLLTTSAFLDLVSREWLERLAALAAARRLPFYAALSFDGRMGATPPQALDDAVFAAVNRHQRRDKGLGGALGPLAAAAAAAAFAGHGYTVMTGIADWDLGPDDRDLQVQLVQGWWQAAAETGAPPAAALAAWRDARAAAASEARLRVGHIDLWAVPEGRP